MPTENEKQLTAMSEHIAWLEEVHAPIGIIKQAKSKLATERQQLKISYQEGWIDCSYTELENQKDDFTTQADDYFNNTFKTQ